MAQAILMQGMRRSGTTILYDALLEDPQLHCFYEPLREDTETPGGGSGARATDPFAETRRLRLEYRDHHWPGLDISEFNLGGPGNPEAEIGPGLPEHCAGFLRTLLEREEPVLIKETRFYDKLEAIRGIAPEDSVLIHVVRDPRAVAASMMTGKSRSRAYGSADEFFGEHEKRKLWSSRQLSRILLQGSEYSHVRRPANFERILLVWKHTFESTWRDGRVLFGDRYVLLRNEELRADPVAAIARVYEAAGRPTPPPGGRVGPREGQGPGGSLRRQRPTLGRGVHEARHGPGVARCRLWIAGRIGRRATVGRGPAPAARPGPRFPEPRRLTLAP